MLGVLLIAVSVNVIHRRNFAEYVGRRAGTARYNYGSDNMNSHTVYDCSSLIIKFSLFKLGLCDLYNSNKPHRSQQKHRWHYETPT